MARLCGRATIVVVLYHRATVLQSWPLGYEYLSRNAARAAPVRAGLAATQESYQLGVEALHEQDVRKRGLLVSLAAILITIVGLWLILRRAERGGAG